MSLRIYNVLTQQKETFAPIQPPQVNFYLCGVTVYGRSHIGHLRCFLSFDAILRYFRYRDYDVRFVRNFTDIDDKIIARAAEISAGPEGAWRQDEAYANYDDAMWSERLDEDALIRERAAGQDRHLAEVVADYFIDVFHNEDFQPFDLVAPMSEPRVSQYIPQIIALIEKIMANGFAYESAGDVYFDVPTYHAKTQSYGRLSGRDVAQMLEGARVAPSDKKRSGPDFVLWKQARPGEPSWPSPWGDGRPGWHIECSAMSVEELGQPFDIHGGGKDLIFPHHENEIAQSEAAAQMPYCHTWMHNGFITVDGVKMSKSLGNFITIAEGLKMAPPEVWRYIVLSTHYANPIDFSRTREVQGAQGTEVVRGSIDIAFDRLEYFYESLQKAAQQLAEAAVDGSDAAGQAPVDDARVDAIKAQFCAAMDDDFNTARAVATIGEGMKVLNEFCDMKAKAAAKLPGGASARLSTVAKIADILREVLGVLGLPAGDPTAVLEGLRDFSVAQRGLDRAWIEAQIDARLAARDARDWARSDEIRASLLAAGVALRAGATGTAWKVLRG